MLLENYTGNLQVTKRVIRHVNQELFAFKVIFEADIDKQQSLLEYFKKVAEDYNRDIVKVFTLSVHRHNYHHELYCTWALAAIKELEQTISSITALTQWAKLELERSKDIIIVLTLPTPLLVVFFTSESESSVDGSSSSSSS